MIFSLNDNEKLKKLIETLKFMRNGGHISFIPASCAKPLKVCHFGCHWFKGEWNASRQLVCASLESLRTSSIT